MALDPVIAGGFRGIELQNPLEAYGRIAQLQNLQQQNALAALQMQKAQRDIEVENRLAQLYQRPGVEPTSPEFMREVYAISPLKGAAFQKSALETQKAQREAEAAAEKLAADRIAGARALLPAVTADSWGAWRADTLRKLPGLAGMIPETYSDEAKLRLLQSADQFLAERKPITVAAGASVYRPGETAPMYTAPAAPSSLAKLLKERAELLPGDPKIPAYEAAIKKATTHQPPTQIGVNVSTEKKYGEALASKLADVDISKMTTAEKAPQLAESANRIINLVNQGNVFIGPASEIKLNIARALNVAGANNAEQIANTEKLIAATGQSTLDAIKGAGLGTGQGFTNKDLDFLRGIAGGTIALTPQTLTELATLQHRVATRSAEAWGKRVREIPKEVIQGTGISMEPPVIPPLVQPKSRVKPPAVGEVRDGYRFKGGDAGNSSNWEKL